MALESPSHRREDGGDGEYKTLPFEGINAHGRGSLLIVPDGPHISSNPRVDEFPRDPKCHQRQAQEEVVIGRRTWGAKKERGAEPEVAPRDLVLYSDEEA